MAINLAAKFETKTSDLVKAKQKSSGFTNKDWDWDGVNAVNIYTLVDPVMGNYDPTAASNRYGTPSEVQDTVQNFALVRDRSWTKVIDKKNFQDTMMIRQPGKYLAQSTKNVLVPEMDAYVFATLGTAANTYGRDTTTGSALVLAGVPASAATTATNAYTNLLAINGNIQDNEAPTENQIAAMTAQYYNYLKQSGFVLPAGDAYADRKTGNLGTVDGLQIVVVPSSRMPANTDLIISHPSVCVMPEKLVDYTLHQNAPGYSGDLLEYRHRYDAFVDFNTRFSLGVHKFA